MVLMLFCLGLLLGALLVLTCIYDDRPLPQWRELGEEMRFLRTVRRIRDISENALDAMVRQAARRSEWF